MKPDNIQITHGVYIVLQKNKQPRDIKEGQAIEVIKKL